MGTLPVPPSSEYAKVIGQEEAHDQERQLDAGALFVLKSKGDKDEESFGTKSQRLSSTKVELKPFTGNENFMLWQRRMKHVLKQQGLSKVLEGKEKKPATMTDAYWEDLDELSSGSIEQHLTTEVWYNAMKDTAKQTWEKLEEMFASKSLSNELFLKEEIHSLKIEEGASMMDHVSAFNRCISDLQRMDEVYKSEDKVVMLLTSLPPSDKHFRTTLMFGKGTLKYEEVMQDILTHDRMVQLSSGVSQDEGLVAKSNEREEDRTSMMARKAIGEGQNPSRKTVVLNVGLEKESPYMEREEKQREEAE